VPGRYADPDLRATLTPARIDSEMKRRVARAIAAIRWNADDIGRFIGRYLSEPKPDVVFACGVRRSRADFERRIGRSGVRLDRRTQLLYDDARLYINGEDRPMPASGASALRELADRRALAPQACAALAPEVIDLLHDWQRHGFLVDTA
jgi:50S ribosomal protein L16 3-hydroxylase